MSGLFGGLLALVEFIGRVACDTTLYILIGEKGKGATPRKGRVGVGGIVIGLLVGGCIFWLTPNFFGAEIIMGLGCFAIVPLLSLFIAIGLEGLREGIDGDE